MLLIRVTWGGKVRRKSRISDPRSRFKTSRLVCIAFLQPWENCRTVGHNHPIDLAGKLYETDGCRWTHGVHSVNLGCPGTRYLNEAPITNPNGIPAEVPYEENGRCTGIYEVHRCWSLVRSLPLLGGTVDVTLVVPRRREDTLRKSRLEKGARRWCESAQESDVPRMTA
jgi:hypothetical protein